MTELECSLCLLSLNKCSIVLNQNRSSWSLLFVLALLLPLGTFQTSLIFLPHNNPWVFKLRCVISAKDLLHIGRIPRPPSWPSVTLRPFTDEISLSAPYTFGLHRVLRKSYRMRLVCRKRSQMLWYPAQEKKAEREG